MANRGLPRAIGVWKARLVSGLALAGLANIKNWESRRKRGTTLLKKRN